MNPPVPSLPAVPLAAPPTRARRLRLPLYSQIVLWFLLNLVVIGLAVYAFLKIQFHLGLDSFLLGRTGERIQAVTDLVIGQLGTTPAEGWTGVLDRISEAYQVECLLFRADGTQEAGPPTELPPEVRARVTEPTPAHEAPRRGPAGGGRGLGPGPGSRRWAAAAIAHPKFIVRSRHPDLYWLGVRFPAPGPPRSRPGPVVLLFASDSLFGGRLFPDLTPWWVLGAGVLMLSVLLWLPLVHRITRSISQMTRAAECLAQGDFTVRVDSARRDELGALAEAVNHMAGRLDGFVQGQKRFLGDVAHELCSPIARLQLALGVLENQLDARQRASVGDMREEIEEMSGLINELLSFSRAGLRERAVRLQPVRLGPLLQRAADREGGGATLHLPAEAETAVLAEPDLLLRAVANLLRNAVRYAGSAGPIELKVVAEESLVRVAVADAGPGVPESELERIFDPFYRLENSRSRATGGTGLGLAIVQTCVQACQGRVTARNRQPHGLEVEIVLKRAPSAAGSGALTAATAH